MEGPGDTLDDARTAPVSRPETKNPTNPPSRLTQRAPELDSKAPLIRPVLVLVGPMHANASTNAPHRSGTASVITALLLRPLLVLFVTIAAPLLLHGPQFEERPANGSTVVLHGTLQDSSAAHTRRFWDARHYLVEHLFPRPVECRMQATSCRGSAQQARR